MLVDVTKCAGCGVCVENCPMEAITIINGKAAIDTSKCVECRMCKINCPMQAINE